MYLSGGRIYNHPLAQAQFGLALLSSYATTADTRYLDLAKAQAKRLLDTAVISRSAAYYPYPFSFARHGNASDVMVAPWYSAIAQGQALALFVWLWEVTGSAAYRDAATRTFNSFVNPRASGVPWTVFVDAYGYLWFEEYPNAVPDRTFNGHIFAIMGLEEYWRVTGSADALRLIQGGATTVAQYLPQIRTPGWISRYCLTHTVRDAGYHLLNMSLLFRLYRVTGSVIFARDGDLLVADYPDDRVSGTVHFAGGTYTGYRFDSAGRVVGSKVATLSRGSGAPASARRRILGRSGAWFLITAGIWAGYWVQERAGYTYIPGRLSVGVIYVPVRTATLAAGTYTGYTFDAQGNVVSSVRLTVGSATSAHIDRWGVINGVPMLEVTDGALAGSWVRLGSGLTY